MTRTAIVLWLLAASCMDSRAAEPIQYMNVSVGQDVMLPCPCSNDTNQLVWQIDEHIIVNHCCKEMTSPDKSYVNRTQLFLSLTNENRLKNCSLLLRDVSLIDMKTFTCFHFTGDHIKHEHVLGLIVEARTENDTIIPNPTASPSTADSGLQTGYLVGIILLILVILLGLVVILLIRKLRQTRSRLVVIQDPQAKVPIMNFTPV